MKISTLEQSVKEAERYIARAKKLRMGITDRHGDDIWGSKESGAVRRASMDLTRVLADLRLGR
jgi:hypothetical protein